MSTLNRIRQIALAATMAATLGAATPSAYAFEAPAAIQNLGGMLVTAERAPSVTELGSMTVLAPRGERVANLGALTVTAPRLVTVARARDSIRPIG